jgi:hypothetical protein
MNCTSRGLLTDVWLWHTCTCYMYVFCGVWPCIMSHKYGYTHTHIHTHMQVRISVYIHTYIHSYIRTCRHKAASTYIHTYMHAYIRTCMYKLASTYIHTYIHTCIHTCTHTHMQAQSSVSVLRGQAHTGGDANRRTSCEWQHSGGTVRKWR